MKLGTNGRFPKALIEVPWWDFHGSFDLKILCISMKSSESKVTALLYRLSGDYNPLHLGPKVAEIAKWKFLAFESWLRGKALDPSKYKQNLGVIGKYRIANMTSLDSSLGPEIDLKVDVDISPDMKLEDLKIYDHEKLIFLSSFVGQATNILLDMDLNPKISDFGLAKLDEDEHTHISTRIIGTVGYMSLEYALWGHLTHKADVYSFGIVALEIIVGKNNMKYCAIENYVCLLDWALALQKKKGNLVELLDPKLGFNFNEEEAIKIIKVTLSCTNPSSVVRPTMFAVVRMLEGDICVKEFMMDQSEYGDDLRFKSLRDKYYELQHQNSSEGQTLIDLSETTQNGLSSTTCHDLYPISLDSH
ncbi:hypothetical protein TEA_003181 [Camellia sinensis var. sinensis]|uniref:Protein kinase domain-containing protein n=1 Tax=Camellia sinensis var. sinensis TaxID=542762 RepID=A0A4S4DMZ1_CAMSN|nr:hypothetical protein TEA_003181 [Camellia sinensis var. sinensis]